MSVTTGICAPTLTLGRADAAEVERVARELCSGPRQRVDDLDWVAAARDAAHSLPVTLRRTLRQFRRNSGDRGILLVRSLPVDEETLPQTPAVEDSVQRSVCLSSAVLIMTACTLGDPFAFRAEKSGALVQDVVPVPGKEDFQGNAGSVALSFHNENAFHQHRPDHVLLLCLRPDHDGIAGLRTVSAREILPLLGAETREALFSPEFETNPPPSFRSGGTTPPHAVFFGAPDDPDMMVDLAATMPMTARAKSALIELQDAFDRTAQSIQLLPGDLAIVDNHVTVHGRTAFQPRYDGWDRWLQRTFVASDLRRSRDHRPQDGYVLAR